MRSWIGGLLVLLLLASNAPAQTLADNAEGKVRVAGNEVVVESKILDPSAIRLRAPAEQGGSGKISFDAGTKEHTLLIGAQSPGQGGEFSLNLLIPGGESTDDAMFKALWVNHEDGFHFRLPVHFDAGGGGGGSGGPPSAMWAPNGLSFTQQQSDGNFVTYTTTVPFSIAPNHVTAVWSSWHGRIGGRSVAMQVVMAPVEAVSWVGRALWP